MTDRSKKNKQQKISGYLLLISGVVFEFVLISLVLFGNSTYLLPIVGGIPAFILIYHGYRSITATHDESQLIEDRNRDPYQRAGQTSFWVLVAVITTDKMLRYLPAEHLHSSLLYIASFVVVSTTIYHKYFSSSSVPTRSDPNNS